MILDSFQLKLIAIITMCIDHIGAVLYPAETVLRRIGRLSFPIFCFLLVEGFFHTKDVHRYMARLGLFALLSEVPYDLAFHGTILEFGKQNVFFTLFFGMALLYLLEKSESMLVSAAEIFLIMWTAEMLRTDYGGRGILLIVIYYLFHERKWLSLTLGAAWNFLYFIQIQHVGAFALIWGVFRTVHTQYFGVAAAVPLALYNGKQGAQIKYFFYLFYPVHLLVLYLLVQLR